MWSVISWLAVIAWASLVVSTYLLIKYANGHKPVQVKVIHTIFLVLFTLIFGASLFAASMQDTFQALLASAIERRPFVLDADDRLAFIWWRWLQRSSNLWVIFASFCYAGFVSWDIGLWSRNRDEK